MSHRPPSALQSGCSDSWDSWDSSSIWQQRSTVVCGNYCGISQTLKMALWICCLRWTIYASLSFWPCSCQIYWCYSATVQPLELIPGTCARGGTGSYMLTELCSGLRVNYFEMLKESVLRISRAPNSGKSSLGSTISWILGIQHVPTSSKFLLAIDQQRSCISGVTLHRRHLLAGPWRRLEYMFPRFKVRHLQEHSRTFIYSRGRDTVSRKPTSSMTTSPHLFTCVVPNHFLWQGKQLRPRRRWRHRLIGILHRVFSILTIRRFSFKPLIH